MRVWTTIMLVGAVLAVTSSCGAGSGPNAVPPVYTGPPLVFDGPPDLTAALDAWKSFPIDRRPRPIVLVETLPRMAGFTTGAAKQAALDANYQLAATLPAAPPTVTAQLPDGPAQFPTLPADQAFAGLRGSRYPAPNPTDALPITRVELGSAEFRTDRGPIALPSWLFHPVDALGPIAWPALPADAFWPHNGKFGIGGATLAADGITLTVSLPAPPGACPGEPVMLHEPVVVESPTAVAVGVRPVAVSTAPGPSVANCAHDAVLRLEPHQVRLAEPLGARVLVADTGAATAVTSS